MICCQKALLCGVALFICASLAFGQRTDIPKEAIKVQIRLDRNEFHFGEEIIFEVIISNAGTQPFLIPNQMLFGSPSHSDLNFEVRDQSGKVVPGVGWAFDCSDYKPTELRYETILNDYLLLRPGTSYVQRTSLGGLYNDLKPGTYHVKTSYSASFSPLGCQRWTSEDIEKFPFKAWYGTTALNDISFTILPKTRK